MTHKESRPYHFEVNMEDDEDLVKLINKLNDANLPKHAVQAIDRDLNRLRKLSPSSSDSGILRSYIECIGSLPWSVSHKEKKINVSFAKAQLDSDHFGIEQVKRRIVEYISVLKLNSGANPPIICLSGPPGVGKTTLAKSIAAALERKFLRISLGGVRDEAEIRGHRRTYVGALPGLFINGMRQCGVKNPVILLDEIDKMVQGTHQGNPAAALLEVLDPAQNSAFKDHFLNLAYDLSQVIFISTANTIEAIPPPLLDRMEVIQLSGYTLDEKIHIAKAHLIPKQINRHGLSLVGLKIPDPSILYICEKHTRESGVRELQRKIASLCRYKCREYVDLDESKKKAQFNRVINVEDIEKILGKPIFERDINSVIHTPGMVNGLAYSGSGNGEIMVIEASTMPGLGSIKLTGSLGKVIQESAHLAVSWIKANAYNLKLTKSPKDNILKDLDLHIHMPSGAVPKDGPSAGISLTVCVLSLLSGKCVPETIAMTGEITLRGQIRPVGGIREKVISAHQAGVQKVIIPAGNRRDVQSDIPANISNSMTFVYCKNIWDVVDAAFNYRFLEISPQISSNL
ncbi:ATP-dependent protease La [Sporodiniella umbellata]|nr:ATP-dependent protease La [Sporodiniella umbellata]